jgi:HKD family nuclease
MITNRPKTLLTTLSKVFLSSDEIFIASAYVSPSACEKLSLCSIGAQKPVSVVIGRAIEEGLTSAAIYYFSQLDKILSINGGGIRISNVPFHSKLYLSKTGKNKRFWLGSSNCTENGLFSWHEANIEVIDKSAITQATRIFNELFINSKPVNSVKVVKHRWKIKSGAALSFSTSPDFPAEEPDTFELSLLDNTGKVPEKSGLNWWNASGRPRKPDEVYIPIRKSALIAMRNVLGFVKRGDEIDAITHDGFTFKVKFAGSEAKDGIDPKNLESSGELTIFGKWILRKALKICPYTLVTKEILERYGRTSLTFYKLTQPDGKPMLYIDFSP